ncbi:MAG TPA: hypothetical protein VFI88_08410 [Sphingomicrobium sp.]|jgi:hypothetical protein|nr:hypothetical protein [Sphingomicrobium sp.]
MFNCLPALILAIVAAAPVEAQPKTLSATVTPAAQELFERDWALMNWALKYYDRNDDMLLEADEAAAAAAEFRKLADTNHDGRVTRDEYRAARELILAHY